MNESNYSAHYTIPDAYRIQWLQEGWDLFVRDDDGSYEIEALDEDTTFGDDATAIEFVVRRALEGSKSHLLAIWLDGRPVCPKRLSMSWIPASLVED